jgi:starvation-inducible DNA-binding protein
MSTTAADRRARSLRTPNLLGRQKAKEIAGALNLLLADLLALYFKTKNFHWHVSGPHFRDYHHLLDEQADQIFAITDTVAERARKVGGTTLHSVGHIGRLQRLRDNDAEYVTPLGMLGELREDNLQLAAYMRETHGVCEEHGDVATASLLEVWIDEAERRIWFLFETSRRGDETPPHVSHQPLGAPIRFSAKLAKRLGGKADAAMFAKERES